MPQPRRNLLAFIAVLLVPLAALGVGLAVTAVASDSPDVGLVDGRLRPCPPGVDCVSSQAAREEARVAPLAFPGDPDESFASLLQYVATSPRAQLLSADAGYGHAVYWTPYLKLAQDVELLLDREARVVHVRAVARIGSPGLETARARVEELRAGWLRPPARVPGS